MGTAIVLAQILQQREQMGEKDRARLQRHPEQVNGHTAIRFLKDF
jgi:hypothetical protein